MENNVIKWEVFGGLFIFLLGALLHFLYQLSGGWRPIGLFVPVNESVWEHLKMILWPALIYGALEYRHIGDITNNFWTAKTLAIYLSMASVVIIFYLYTSILRYNTLFADILLFGVSIAIGQLFSWRLLTSPPLPSWADKLTIPLLSLIIFFFFMFTFCPPKLPIFKNPVDGTYGI